MLLTLPEGEEDDGLDGEELEYGVEGLQEEDTYMTSALKKKCSDICCVDQ